MYLNNLKSLRLRKKLTQDQIAIALNCERRTYTEWELNRVSIPLEMADSISLYYKVSLAYVLGVETKYNICITKKLNYQKLLENLLLCKIDNRYKYKEIAEYLGCSKSTAYDYLNGKIKIKVEVLISLAELFNKNIDELCAKK